VISVILFINVTRYPLLTLWYGVYVKHSISRNYKDYKLTLIIEKTNILYVRIEAVDEFCGLCEHFMYNNNLN